MHCVDLGESFPNSNEYLLAKSAWIQPGTSPSKFGVKFNSLLICLPTEVRGGRARGAAPALVAVLRLRLAAKGRDDFFSRGAFSRGRSRPSLAASPRAKALASLSLFVSSHASLCFSLLVRSSSVRGLFGGTSTRFSRRLH